MANRYWVGGNANWDATAGTKWATTSGGAGGAAVPTAADDVFLDNGAGTGNVTIPASTTVTCRSLNCTGYIKTLTFAATTSIINIGDGTAGASNVALLFVSGMTLTLTGVGSIVLKSTSATQQTIDTGGLTMPAMTFQGAGSSYLCNDAINTASTTTTTFTNGTLDLNGKSHVFGLFSLTGSSARTLTFNGAAITCAGVGNAWNATTTTNLTFTPDTGSITCSGAGSILGTMSFIGGGLTYNTVSITGSGVASVTGANTFGTLTISGGANPACEVRFSANQTVTGTLTLNGNSITNRCCLRSSGAGASRTLSAATLSSNGYVDLIDITAGGASSPWTNTGWGVSNVTNITGATPVTTYWVGGTGDSNDATKYASSSGGTANTQRAPLLQDTAYYDANSGTGTVTIKSYRVGTMDFSNCALTSISMVGGFAARLFNGNFILNPNVSMTFGGFADAVNFISPTSQTITTAGTTMGTHAYQVNSVGTVNLGSSWTSSTGVTIAAGTLTTNSYPVSCLTFGQSAGTLNAGDTTFTLTSTTTGATIWSVTGGTSNMGTSNIISSNSTAINQTFAGGGRTYFNVILTPSGGTFTFTGSNTVNSLQMASAGTKTIKFTASTITTILSDCFFRGTSGNLITISSTTGGTQFGLTYSAKTIRTDYISLQDCLAAGATPFYAGANSTNVSGNTNWTFGRSPREANMFLGV